MDSNTRSATYLSEAKAMQGKLTEIRRTIHRQPELGMQEFKTAALVQSRLTELGIPYEANVGGTTAVVGTIQGAGQGPCVALRADMDALPLQERNQTEYVSQVPNKMHACGHDAHTTALLGAAELLAKHRNEFNGTVKLFFQPAEEGPGGAEPMIAAGVMANPKVDAVFGLHCSPLRPVGSIGLRAGATHAAADGFEIRVIGQGGHGAHPDQGVDALVCGAQLVTALQTIVSREMEPTHPAVVTVGTFHSGVRSNILADETVMTGTVRVTDRDLRKTMPGRLERLANSVAEAFRCKAEVEYTYGAPSGFSDPTMAELVKRVAGEVVGPENIFEDPISMGGEDFACFTDVAPGCMFSLGVGNVVKGFTHPLHHPCFDLDEDALAIGAATLASTAVACLASLK